MALSKDEKALLRAAIADGAFLHGPRTGPMQPAQLEQVLADTSAMTDEQIRSVLRPFQQAKIDQINHHLIQAQNNVTKMQARLTALRAVVIADPPPATTPPPTTPAPTTQPPTTPPPSNP